MRLSDNLGSGGVPRLVLAACLVVAAPGCGSGADAPQPPLLDLVEAAAHAEVTRETGRIDLGTYPARFHLVDGWSGADQERDGVTFVWGQGYESTLRFTVWRPRQRRLILRGRPFVGAAGSPDWRVGVELNGTQVTELALEDGRPSESVPEVGDLGESGAGESSAVDAARYREYHVTLPGNLMEPGENLLRLRYRLGDRGADPFIDEPRHGGSRAVAWDLIELMAPLDHGEPEAREDGAVLELPLMTRVEYHVLAVPGAELRVATLEPTDPAITAQNTVVEVELRPAGAVEPSRHFLRPGDADVRLPLPIPSDGTHPVRIALMATSQRRLGGDVTGLRLVRPAVRVAGEGEGAVAAAPLEPAGTTLPRPPENPWQERPDVLVYLIDALRADHLGLHGYARDTSPELDAFAEDAVVFLRGVANSAWTRSAVASLFTGLYPESHGVLGRDDALSPEARTLARRLGELGYATAAVATNGNVSQGYGFPIGFDTWVQLRERRSETIHQYSDRVNEEVFAWLDARDPDAPFLLYAHTTDPHEPYTPPAPYRSRFAPDVPDGAIHRPIRIAELVEQRPDFDLEGLNRDFVDLYDAEIAFNDAQFGRLMEHLRSLGLYDDMLIVVLADHGEEFLDHGGWAHGKTLYREQLHIPMIVKFPGNWAAGTRVDALAEQVDVLPTVLDVVGLEAPPDVQGNSMLGAPLAGEYGPLGMALAQLSLDGRRTAALLTDRWKLIRRQPSLHQFWGVELYDLWEDPREQVDVAGERPVVAGYLRHVLRLLESGQTAVLTAGQANPDPEMVERLRELGYLR